MSAIHQNGHGLAPRRHHHHGHGAGGKAACQRVGAARQNDRHTRAEHDSGSIGLGEKRQALGKHVPRLKIGGHEDIGAPGNQGHELLDHRGLRTDRIVERQRPIDKRTTNLPPSAILHNAAASIVEGTLAVTVSIALKIATRTSWKPIARARSIAFWTISAFASRSGAILTAASVTMRVLGIPEHP